VEFQADWEDLKKMLSPIKLFANTTGFLLSLQPNQLERLFPLNDDASSRNLLVLLPRVLTIVV